MKLEEKVLSLELSKELWNKGVRIETEFIRYVGSGNVDKREIELWQVEKNPNTPIYPAPLLIELLEVMPITVDGCTVHMGRGFHHGGYFFYYDGDLILEDNSDTNPCNAVAKTLIWLLDNNHITVKEINNGKNRNGS